MRFVTGLSIWEYLSKSLQYGMQTYHVEESSHNSPWHTKGSSRTRFMTIEKHVGQIKNCARIVKKLIKLDIFPAGTPCSNCRKPLQIKENVRSVRIWIDDTKQNMGKHCKHYNTICIPMKLRGQDVLTWPKKQGKNSNVYF